MIRTLTLLCCLSGTAATADILGLNDYDALFADPATEVTILDDGSEAIEIDGQIQISRNDDRITTLDITNTGAVGCFVQILSQIEAYQSACDDPIEAEFMENHRTYLDRILAFYAANTAPVSDVATVRQRYDAYVEATTQNARQYCAGDGQVETFMRSVLAASTAAAVDQMTSTPRLPADNPCI